MVGTQTVKFPSSRQWCFFFAMSAANSSASVSTSINPSPLPSVSLERPSKRRRFPTEKAVVEFNAAAFLENHVQEIQTFVILGMRPAAISAKLRTNYGVDIDSKLISNKLKNWKVNGKIKVPPLNDESSRATDTPYPPTKCMKVHFFSKI